MKVHASSLSLLVFTAFVVGSKAQEAPKGSITIDRISDIKYPTDQA